MSGEQKQEIYAKARGKIGEIRINFKQKEQPMETKDDGYGIFLSPCYDCYKRSFSTVVGNKGLYCLEGIWDSRGMDKDKRGMNKDGGENLRGKCDKQFVIEDA